MKPLFFFWLLFGFSASIWADEMPASISPITIESTATAEKIAEKAPEKPAEPLNCPKDNAVIALEKKSPDPACFAQACAYPSKPSFTLGTDAQKGAVEIFADQSEGDESGRTKLSGQVRLEYQNQILEAGELNFDRQTGIAQTKTPIHYQGNNLDVQSQSVLLDAKARRVSFEKAEFMNFNAQFARGGAETLTVNAKKQLQLDNGFFTTCPPENNDWALRAQNIAIQDSEGFGTAKNIRLEFKGVPIMYLPYFTFPVSRKRKTGFLLPEFRSSDRTGLEVSAPFYWNIAPNYDLTIRPRFMTERGLEIGGQARYLWESGYGEADLRYLNNDSKTGETRTYSALRYAGLLGQRWDVFAQYGRVSDQLYFNDFGQTAEEATQLYLNRETRFSYRAPSWVSAQFLVQGYQTVAPNVPASDLPYRRLPEIRVNVINPGTWHGFRAGADLTATRFARENSLEGLRVDLRPNLNFTEDRAAWFVDGNASWRYTNYDLRGLGQTLRKERLLPTVQIQSGVRLERVTNSGLLQTLEPRIQYLYTPFEDQNALPLFDTGEPEFNYDQLFNANRFSGLDRISDANDLTLAMSSRWVNPATGRVRAEAAFGQIFRFSPSQVLVNNPAPARSEMVAQFNYHVSNAITTRFLAQFEPESGQFQRAGLQAQYRPDERHLVAIGYRYRRNLLEQANISAVWPITQKIGGIGRWEYSLRENQSIDTMVGLEYQSCCWAFRTAWRKFTTGTGTPNTVLYFQLELKGLTRLGDRLENILTRQLLPNDYAR